MYYNDNKGNMSMKKEFIAVIILLTVFVAGVKVFGEVVTTRKIRKPTNQQPSVQTQIKKKTTSQIVKPSGNRLADSIKMCRPYSETLDSNVGGVNFNFKVKIAGWVNNKCRLDFIAQSTGINQMFTSLYGVDPSDATVMTFEPNVRCDFTKAQLQSVGDSILQEDERNKGARNNMLKNPSDIDLSALSNPSESDAKLLDIILKDRACTILNSADSNGMFDAFFGY